MKWLSLIFLALMIGACSSQDVPNHPAGKTTISINPFSGQDEDGYTKGIGGTAEAFRNYFQVITRRMAIALDDVDTRSITLDAIWDAPNKEAQISKLLYAHPELLDDVSDGFKKEIIGTSIADSKIPDSIDHLNDSEAFMAVCEAMFGLEIRLINGPSSGPIPVFHDQIVDEKDAEKWEGFFPDGEPETMTYSLDGFTRSDPFFIYLI